MKTGRQMSLVLGCFIVFFTTPSASTADDSKAARQAEVDKGVQYLSELSKRQQDDGSWRQQNVGCNQVPIRLQPPLAHAK
jgi:hypothetical protein